MVALFERAVGLYGELVNVNAYHQPGVEAGKKAAAAVLSLQKRVVALLDATPRTVAEIAQAMGAPEQVERVFWILRHMAFNQSRHSGGWPMGKSPDTAVFKDWCPSAPQLRPGLRKERRGRDSNPRQKLLL